jgi:hypothetical protein
MTKLFLTDRWQRAVRTLTGQCAYCLTDHHLCRHAHTASRKKQALEMPRCLPPCTYKIVNSRSAGGFYVLISYHEYGRDSSLEPVHVETLSAAHAWIAKHRHDRALEEQVARARLKSTLLVEYVHAAQIAPLADLRLAFALMLGVADRIDESDFPEVRCKAKTETGRAIQAAIKMAQAAAVFGSVPADRRQEVAAAKRLIELVREFLGSKPKRQVSPGEADMLRLDWSSIFLLAGSTREHLARLLGCDGSALRKRLGNDLDEIERQYGHLCNNYTDLLPKKPTAQSGHSGVLYSCDSGHQHRWLMEAIKLAADEILGDGPERDDDSSWQTVRDEEVLAVRDLMMTQRAVRRAAAE